ncbi:MAG TPA: mycothiol synthase [Actinoplanes sp.]|nr:mycothiol synthase [Actinoplanes sp.]
MTDEGARRAPTGTGITERRSLDPAEVAEVLALLAAATDADGVTPVSEPVLLDLEHARDPRARHFLARRGGELAGYAYLDVTDVVAGPSAELAVHPARRGQGVGTALVETLEAASTAYADGRLRLWAHGRHPLAVALAHGRGYVEERVLWQLRRSLLSHIPDAPMPPGIRLRAFRPGADEPAWVEVNNRAFADHPDQGGWTVADVEAREAEPWFDPAGFLLAERAETGELVGFHWTKVHHGQAAPGAGSPSPIGEVYVLGVDPSARGLRLGPALTVAGLRHLRGRGLSQVLLYVDESNTRAVRLYEGLGFRKWDADVQFRRARPGPRRVHRPVTAL